MYASKKKTNNKNFLRIGDVVIIKDDKLTPRTSWKMGRVESLIVAGDKNVRGAVLFTRSIEGKCTRIPRPLQKLIPLEVQAEFGALVKNETSVDPKVRYSANVSDIDFEIENASKNDSDVEIDKKFD